MGGGDLNTKKSWHPNTMRNQEKVWKAEQAEANERRRIEDLRREMDNERSKEELIHHGQSTGVLAESSSKKMDWMYKQPHEGVNREQYLLGKKIDKTFEKLVSEEKSSHIKAPPKNHVEHECIPFSIRNLSADTTSREFQVDMARKMMEDPLVAIRQRELESRAQLLQNPVKLKELTTLLRNEQEKKSKKKDKKNKKSHRKSPDIDRKLVEKLNKLKGVKDKNIDLNDLLSSHKSKKKSSKKKNKLCSSDSDEEISGREQQRKRRLSREKRFQPSEKREECPGADITKSSDRGHTSDRFDTHRKYYNDNCEEDYSVKKKNYGLVRADGTHIEIKESHNESYKRKPVPEKVVNKPYEKFYQHRRLTEFEKEEKRREMIKDAKERDKERERNVSYYKERDRKQEEQDNKQGYKEGFVEKHLRETSKHLSVESRIKSNVYNIQRSSRHMDSNFAKR